MTGQTYSFGYWLRRRRKALDLTQDQLAQAVSCSHFAIRKIEADERRPSRALATRLADRLGVPTEERAAFLAAARGVQAGLTIDGQPVLAPVADTRPAADEVVDPARAASTAEVPPAATNPRDEPKHTPPHGFPDAGGVFVGRDDELRRIDEALAAVRAGGGRFVAITGQPGIGKTTLAREAARRAGAAGVRVLWGRAIEDAGAPPYWPWVQALRDPLESLAPAAAVQLMGAGARWIAEIVPEAGELAGANGDDRASDTDPARARFLLFDAMAQMLRRLSATQPIAIVFDDLHSADPASLRLLAHVAAEVAASRVMLVATYRDVGPDRLHPLHETLADCARSPGFVRLVLQGLSREETRVLVTMLSGRPDEATRLFERTEGHPLFLAQLAASPVLDAAGELARLPAGIREAIASRLNRLGADCNRLLSVASVIGRDVEYGVLVRAIDDLDADRCLTALEEALAAQILLEDREADLYRFGHALIRDAIHEGLSGPRRQRMHLRVGQVLEAMAGDDPSRIAYHYAAAPPQEAARQALDYSCRAAAQAMRLHAFEDAVRHGRFARSQLKSVGPAVASMALSIDLDLGTAETAAGDYEAARETFGRAAVVARAAGDPQALARAAIGFEEASWRPGWPGATSVSLLEEALAATPEGADRDRARLLASLTRALIFSGAVQPSNERSDAAIATARRSGDDATLADALCCGLSARWVPERLGTRLAAAQEAMLICERIGDRERWLRAAPWRLFDLLELGDHATFTAEHAAVIRRADESRQPFWIYTAASFGPALALMRGDLVASERAAGELLALGERQAGLDARGVHATQMFAIRREQGRLRELAPLVRHFLATTPAASVWRPGLALVLAEIGRIDDARAALDGIADDDFAAVPRDGMWVASIAHFAEVAVALGDPVRCDRIATLLRPYQHRNLLAGTAVACLGAGSRLLGMLATITRRWDEAERDFEHALSMNARQGAWLWLAHTQVAYATMLAARRDANDATRARRLCADARAIAGPRGLARVETRVDALLAPGGPLG